jgi:uncharacterized protein YdiU (UPF0061 family)
MNRYALLFSICAALGISTLAQAPDRAAILAAQQEAAERDRLIMNRFDELQRTISTQQSDVNRLKTANENLVRRINDMEAKFREAIGTTVTQKQLEKLVESLKKVDENRLSDRNLFIEQLKDIKKVASEKPAPIIITNTPPPVDTPRRSREKDKTEDEPAPLTNPNGYYQYTVQPKDNLSAIVSAYNAEFKNQGKAAITIDMVKKANPKINPNNIPVGKVLQIPIPADKP